MSSAESRRATAVGREKLEEAFPAPETLRLQEYSQAQSNPITAEEIEEEDDVVQPAIDDLNRRYAVLEDRNAYKSNPGVLMADRIQDNPQIYNFKPDNRDLLKGFKAIPENKIFYGVPGLLPAPAQQDRSMGVDWGRTDDEMRGMTGTLALYRKNYASINPVVDREHKPFSA